MGLGRPAAARSPVVFTAVPRQNLEAAPAPKGLEPVDWFAGAQLRLLYPDGRTETLSEGFWFDGKRLLFAAKKRRGEPWSIWEMDLQKRSARQVAPSPRDCRSPIYVSSLFTLDSPEPWFTIVYVGTEPWRNEAGTAPDTGLFDIRLDGKELRRVTANPGNDLDPVQMQDGRVLFASWQFPRRPGEGLGRVKLFGVFVDGVDLALYGAVQGRRVQRMPCPLPDGTVVFVESDRPEPDGAGRLAAVLEMRPFYTYRELKQKPGFLYLYPSEWDDHRFLVSRRPAKGGAPAQIVLRDAAGEEERAVYADPRFHCVQAKAVRPRAVPDGRSTVVDLARKTGLFYALNCYDADERFRPYLKKGDIRRLRVIEGVPLPEAKDGSKAWARRVLGVIPVEEDGSFNIEVPATVPIELQTLDSNGLALATCGWIWVEPRERRGCIGCHEDPERTPENIFVKAVQHPSTPLTLPYRLRRSPDFRRDVLPLLAKRCAAAECHGDPDNPLNLSAAVDPSEEGLRGLYRKLTGLNPETGQAATVGKRIYVRPGEARKSPLVWALLGRRTVRPWDGEVPGPRRIRKMPPRQAAPLAPEDLERIIEWIDMGAPWEGAPPEAASVTDLTSKGTP